MIQNKAPHYDEVLEELEEDIMLTDVRKVNGNVIKARFDSSTYGNIRFPAYTNWYVTRIRNKTDFATIIIEYIG